MCVFLISLSLLRAQVKSQLHTCISRHLEFLRSREVWLREQIDLVEQLKAETLQNQLQQLYWVSHTHTHTLTLTLHLFYGTILTGSV